MLEWFDRVGYEADIEERSLWHLFTNQPRARTRTADSTEEIRQMSSNPQKPKSFRCRTGRTTC